MKKADSGGIDSAGICLTGNRVPDTVHRFHRSQSAFDPHSIVWIYERKKGRNVRRIFLRSPD